MQPLDISSTDVRLIMAELNNVPYDRHVNCLEWGAGGSTLFFPRKMSALGFNYSWLSIEHDPTWFNRVTLATANIPGVRVELRGAFPPFNESMDTYVDYPFSLRRRFNFVFVDGRMRRRCLIAASKLLAVGGVVMLHDAERTYYHSAFDHYTRHERIGDKLWRGWIDI